MTGPEGRGARLVRPLQPVALGLLVVALTARLDGYDAVADPLGWALVLLGVGRLPADLPRRRALVVLAALALAVSLPLFVPTVVEALLDADPSLAWAANLPQLAFTGLLCHVLAGRAAAAGDRRPAAWLRLAATLVVAVALAPVLVFGVGLDQLEVASYLLGAVTLLLVIGMLLAWGGRGWAGAVERPGSHESPARDPSGP